MRRGPLGTPVGSIALILAAAALAIALARAEPATAAVVPAQAPVANSAQASLGSAPHRLPAPIAALGGPQTCADAGRCPAGAGRSAGGGAPRRGLRAIRVVRDGDDTAGRLDIAAASARVLPARRGRPRSLMLRLETHARWPSSVIDERRPVSSYVAFEFDRGRGTDPAMCLETRLRTSGLNAQMRSPVCAIPFAMRIGRPAPARRSRSHRAIAVTVPLRYLGARPLAHRFRGTSSFGARGHRRCRPPSPPPPESVSLGCRDVTRWVALPGRRRAR